jgi:hypothetical protein
MTTVEQLIRQAAGLDEVGAVEKTASTKLDLDEAKKISSGLMKIASLPYKADVYNSVKEVMKIAADSINSLLSEIEEKQSELSHLTKVAEIREIIDSMIERGLIEKTDIQEKTAELLKKDHRDLEIVKEAIALGSVTSKNIFFEQGEKVAGDTSSKRSIFDGVDGL